MFHVTHFRINKGLIKAYIDGNTESEKMSEKELWDKKRMMSILVACHHSVSHLKLWSKLFFILHNLYLYILSVKYRMLPSIIGTVLLGRIEACNRTCL